MLTVLIFILSILGLSTVIADSHLPHGSTLRVIPGIIGIIVLMVSLYFLKKGNNRFYKKLTYFMIIIIAITNLIVFADWALWSSNLISGNIELKNAQYKVEIAGVSRSDLYEIDDDWYLLVVEQKNIEEAYHIFLKDCIVSYSPNFKINANGRKTIEVDKNIVAGKKTGFDLNVSCSHFNGYINIRVNSAKEPNNFEVMPIILGKEIELKLLKNLD